MLVVLFVRTKHCKRGIETVILVSHLFFQVIIWGRTRFCVLLLMEDIS